MNSTETGCMRNEGARGQRWQQRSSSLFSIICIPPLHRTIKHLRISLCSARRSPIHTQMWLYCRRQRRRRAAEWHNGTHHCAHTEICLGRRDDREAYYIYVCIKERHHDFCFFMQPPRALLHYRTIERASGHTESDWVSEWIWWGVRRAQHRWIQTQPPGTDCGHAHAYHILVGRKNKISSKCKNHSTHIKHKNIVIWKTYFKKKLCWN